jgi:hypothetical protein
MKTGFFQSSANNNSSTRLIGFITVMVALVYTGAILFLGRDNILTASVSASTFFLAVASPTFVYMYRQKKDESKNTPAQ